MREIKFRGICFRNVKWVYGDFFSDLEEEMPYIRMIINESGSMYEPPETYQKDFHIRLETVGQYTGLKDKNGVEIYEGDIAKTLTGRCSISFFEGSFVCYDRNLPFTFGASSQSLEIIGNIHENTELLKGK